MGIVCNIEEYKTTDGMGVVSIQEQQFIFSEIKDFAIETEKFYICKNVLTNTLEGFNENECEYIGYLASGEIEYLEEFSKLYAGKIDRFENMQTDIKLAIKSLSKELEKTVEIEELPIHLYIVGHSALQYWEGVEKFGVTKDLDVRACEPENLFEQKEFVDAIRLVDRKVKSLKENSDDKDLIINDDAKRQYFPFEASYTTEIIDPRFLILHITDEESCILNKVYAYFECLMMAQDNNFRTKDADIVNSFFRKRHINDKETLLSRYPEFRDIQETNMKWEDYFRYN